MRLTADPACNTNAGPFPLGLGDTPSVPPRRPSLIAFQPGTRTPRGHAPAPAARTGDRRRLLQRPWQRAGRVGGPTRSLSRSRSRTARGRPGGCAGPSPRRTSRSPTPPERSPTRTEPWPCPMAARSARRIRCRAREDRALGDRRREVKRVCTTSVRCPLRGSRGVTLSARASARARSRRRLAPAHASALTRCRQTSIMVSTADGTVRVRLFRVVASPPSGRFRGPATLVVVVAHVAGRWQGPKDRRNHRHAGLTVSAAPRFARSAPRLRCLPASGPRRGRESRGKARRRAPPGRLAVGRRPQRAVVPCGPDARGSSSPRRCSPTGRRLARGGWCGADHLRRSPRRRAR
jgi:hypothetical protein